jgi:hypothetical protein
MHAIYIRGVLLRVGDRFLRLRALLQQVSGAVAGWASSVRQHIRWSQAPESNLLALRGGESAASLAGRYPRRAPRRRRPRLVARSRPASAPASPGALICLGDGSSLRLAQPLWTYNPGMTQGGEGRKA